jgi:hypothetical protein
MRGMYGAGVLSSDRNVSGMHVVGSYGASSHGAVSTSPIFTAATEAVSHKSCRAARARKRRDINGKDGPAQEPPPYGSNESGTDEDADADGEGREGQHQDPEQRKGPTGLDRSG